VFVLAVMCVCGIGLREYFSQEDGVKAVARMPKMVGAESDSNSETKDAKTQDASKQQSHSIEQANVEAMDEESDDEEDYQEPEAYIEVEIYCIFCLPLFLHQVQNLSWLQEISTLLGLFQDSLK
jgi:hypothetical protein